MSGVLTLAATVAAAAGAVAAYRFIDRRQRQFGDMLQRASGKKKPSKIIECERDPETGVYRPRR